LLLFRKCFFPSLVILPGLIAIALPTQAPAITLNGPKYFRAPLLRDKGLIPQAQRNDGAKPSARQQPGIRSFDYDLAVPNLCFIIFPNGMLGLALTALLASYQFGMAALSPRLQHVVTP